MQVDYEKLASELGYKNSATAVACFSPVKKKILGCEMPDNERKSPGAKSPKRAKTLKPTKGVKRNKEFLVAVGDEVASEEASPCKKTCRGSKQKNIKNSAVGIKDEDEDEVV
jgi:hypothetical protein